MRKNHRGSRGTKGRFITVPAVGQNAPSVSIKEKDIPWVTYSDPGKGINCLSAAKINDTVIVSSTRQPGMKFFVNLDEFSQMASEDAINRLRTQCTLTISAIFGSNDA